MLAFKTWVTQPLQRRQHPARKIYTSSTGNINVSILFRTHYIKLSDSQIIKIFDFFLITLT